MQKWGACHQPCLLAIRGMWRLYCVVVDAGGGNIWDSQHANGVANEMSGAPFSAKDLIVLVTHLSLTHAWGSRVHKKPLKPAIEAGEQEPEALAQACLPMQQQQRAQWIDDDKCAQSHGFFVRDTLKPRTMSLQGCSSTAFCWHAPARLRATTSCQSRSVTVKGKISMSRPTNTLSIYACLRPVSVRLLHCRHSTSEREERHSLTQDEIFSLMFPPESVGWLMLLVWSLCVLKRRLRFAKYRKWLTKYPELAQ